MKKILHLGAGLVTGPIVKYILGLPDYQLTIATRTVAKANQLLGGHPRGRSIAWTTDQPEVLNKLVAEHDLTVSFLPFMYHVMAADMCLTHGKHFVTTSYVSPAMRERDAPAKAKGLIFLNEVGLDPGLDHMSAMKVIHEAESKGGVVVSFRSYCGGLPAPEAVTSPWKYKFSWAPRGVVVAARNDGKFLEDGKVVSIPGIELFKHHHPLRVEGVGELEAYTNRDCLGYIDLYGLKNVRTMFRGTLRYPGWCDLWFKVRKLGLMELDEMKGIDGLSFAQFMARLIKVDDTKEIRAKVGKTIDEPIDSPVMQTLEWLGLFGNDKIDASAPTPLDVFAARLLQKLQYAPGERDLVVMVHLFEVEYPKQKRRERIVSTLVDFGIPHGDTSMARTVSLPAAVATAMILDKKITKTGVLIPVDPEIYTPVLTALAKMGIAWHEKTEAL
jgi:saccharopine dehydrogenase-like NADP-dependent oxidoreductase